MGNIQYLLIAIIYTLVLAIFSLIPFKGVSVSAPEYSDKIFHFMAYALLCFLWYKALIKTSRVKKARALLWASVIAIIIGIILEVLQGSLTQNRTADFIDVIANISGIVIMVLFLRFRNIIEVKK